jgi:hypothetical protein
MAYAIHDPDFWQTLLAPSAACGVRRDVDKLGLTDLGTLD